MQLCNQGASTNRVLSQSLMEQVPLVCCASRASSLGAAHQHVATSSCNLSWGGHKMHGATYSETRRNFEAGARTVHAHGSSIGEASTGEAHQATWRSTLGMTSWSLAVPAAELERPVAYGLRSIASMPTPINCIASPACNELGW